MRSELVSRFPRLPRLARSDLKNSPVTMHSCRPIKPIFLFCFPCRRPVNCRGAVSGAWYIAASQQLHAQQRHALHNTKTSDVDRGGRSSNSGNDGVPVQDSRPGRRALLLHGPSCPISGIYGWALAQLSATADQVATII